MSQLQMTGDDWLSDGDKKRQARAEAARKKAALVCAKRLRAAGDSLSEFMSACLDCQDSSAPRGVDDSRRILMESLCEYASWLEGVYDK